MDDPDENGNTPLMLAALYGNIESVDCLLSYEADWAMENFIGYNVVFLAASEGKKDVLRLLEQGKVWFY